MSCHDAPAEYFVHGYLQEFQSLQFVTRSQYGPNYVAGQTS